MTSAVVTTTTAAGDDSGDADGGSSGAGSSGAGPGSGSTAEGGSAAEGDSSGSAHGSDGGEGSSGGSAPVALASLGSLVVLGDSISDGGGGSPFYYQLLRDDLEGFYGPLTYVNHADSGSETDALLGQVNDLPGTLPGPVAVVITSGGNDMKSNIVAVIAGLDGPARAAMQANIAAAHQALLAPGRFGPGVEVHVFEGNVYDASDGVGDFGANDCAFGDGFPTIATDPFFQAWNDAIAETVTASGQVAVDMHGWFYGHGYHNPPNWYASDCTHPSSLGHDQLRRLFYEQITGESLP
jgi:lysophospholipase L1-like esterase